ncbi:MAG: T9SS type A sorting domain-containing protein [Bacteroidia bacterium]
MKKLIFTSILVVASFFPVSAQILNGGFENWSNDTIFDIHPTFRTGTYGLGYIFTGQSNVTRVSGCDGFGIRMESVANGNDTIPGFIYTGKEGFDISGGGTPYTGTPDSLKLCLRYNIVSGDTGFVALFFQSGGQFVNISLIPFTDSLPAWTQVAFDLDTFVVQPDTLIMLFTSGNFDYPLPGSWLEVDNIAFTGTNEQIADPGFETWISISDEEPDDWFSPDRIIVAAGGNPTVTRSVTAFEGSAAIQIETQILPFEDTLAFVTNGRIDENGISGGKPYTGPARPVNLGGFYKYIPVGNDTAFAYVQFSVYNGFTGQREILGAFTRALPPAAEWDYFEVETDLSGAILNPDTVTIVFASSDPDHIASTAPVGIGSVLQLDALAFDQTDGLGHWPDTHNLNIYPNPVADDLYVEWEMDQPGENITAEILGINGQIVYKETLQHTVAGKNQRILNLSSLSPGVYALRLSGENQAFSVRKKVVIHR